MGINDCGDSTITECIIKKNGINEEHLKTITELNSATYWIHLNTRLEIAEYLEFSDLLTLSYVCKKMYQDLSKFRRIIQIKYRTNLYVQSNIFVPIDNNEWMYFHYYEGYSSSIGMFEHTKVEENNYQRMATTTINGRIFVYYKIQETDTDTTIRTHILNFIYKEAREKLHQTLGLAHIFVSIVRNNDEFECQDFAKCFFASGDFTTYFASRDFTTNEHVPDILSYGHNSMIKFELHLSFPLEENII